MTEAEAIVWTAFTRWLSDCGFHLEVREGLELQQRLFAMPRYAARLPWRACRWLPRIGFPQREARPSPLVAYRLDAIHARVLAQPWPTMNELLALASAEPGKIRRLRVVR
jgi:hypothetical protein